MHIDCAYSVVTELACGSLKARTETIGYLKALDTLPVLSAEDMSTLIESHALFSQGIGFVDVQLLASTLVSPETRLWTADKRLYDIALEMEIAY